ncbi:MAG TPA: YlxR family protein [Thermodesulfobacteriota bacterium]|nr:YlxR family protein [Thermodesulfobacteriota bacterium]
MKFQRHVPIRMCVGCGNRRKKGDLIRFVRGGSGSVSITSENLAGRGIYLCPDLACLFAASKKMRRTGVLGSADIAVLRSRIAKEREKQEEKE